MASRPPDTRQPKLTFSSRSPELQRKTRERPNLKIRFDALREILTDIQKQKIRLDALRDILRCTDWAKKTVIRTLVRLGSLGEGRPDRARWLGGHQRPSEGTSPLSGVIT